MRNISQYRLSELLIPKQLMFNVKPFDTYKQIKLRIKHQGVELRCLKKGSEIGSKQYLAKTGQFIISKIDARNGAMGIIPDSLDNAIVTGDFLLYDFNTKLIIPQYFSYISQTPFFDNSCKICSEGSTNRVRLKLDRFLNLSIELPPIQTQEKVVLKIEKVKSRLDEIQSLREEQTKDINNLLFSKYTDLIESADWLPMKEVAPIHRRQVEVNPEETYYEIGVRSFGRGLFENPSFKGSDLTWQKPFWMREGDLLFSNIKAWEGAVGLIPAKYDGWVGSHRYITCLPNLEIIDPEFLYYYFRTFEGVEKLSSASPGTVDRNRTLNNKLLQQIEIPAPSLGLQREFVELLEKTNAIKEHHKQTEQDLTEIMPSLLDKAFKGEL
ncbi:MAG: restriction endonuclease subunit S [Sphingobacteriales bacterium]|nr:restriction endonuclease subunit S [Sphingobacteriales bacterium]